MMGISFNRPASGHVNTYNSLMRMSRSADFGTGMRSAHLDAGRIRDSRDFVSIILAGGTGGRFVYDTSVPHIDEDCKILAPLDGTPLLHHVVNMIPTSDVIIVPPGQRNLTWDARIRKSLTPEPGLQGIYGKVVHYTEGSDDDWMKSFSVAMEKARHLGYRTAFILMGDSFLDANQREAMAKAMLSPYDNIIFHSDHGCGRHIIKTGFPDINNVGRVEDYRVIDEDSPEGRMEILYMISADDFLSFRDNDRMGGLDQFFISLRERQAVCAERNILGGAAVPLRHSDINVNTKAQLRELDRHVYGFPHTWWGKYSQFGRSYPDVLGHEILPDIEDAAGLPKGLISPVQINYKGAVFKWKSHGRTAYIKIFAPAECGAMRHISNCMAHSMFPELFPLLRYHGTVKGYLVDVEDDLSAQDKTRLDMALDGKSWQDMLDDTNPGNVEIREALFGIMDGLKKKPFSGGIPDFRFPALQLAEPLLIAENGIDSLFPQPSPDIPIGYEYFMRYMFNIRGAFEKVRAKKPEADAIGDTVNMLCAAMSDNSGRIKERFDNESGYFHSHGDFMPYNIFLPDKVLDGEYFHVAPFSFELATLVTGMMGIFAGSDPDFIAYSRDFIGGFTGLFEKHEAGLSGSGSSNYVEHTPLLPLIALKLMQEAYHGYFHCGLNAESRVRIAHSLELAKDVVEWFRE